MAKLLTGIRRGVRTRATAIAAALACVLGVSCHREWTANFQQAPAAAPRKIDRGAPFAKCHLANGNVIVLQDWKVDAARKRLTGTGVEYDVDRIALRRGPLEVPLEQIVVLETNRPENVTDGGVVPLAVMTTVSLVVTVACLANPKACFGSCPTFYVGTPEGPSLRAEGFSGAIARVAEETDIDSLGVTEARAGRFDVTMTNEALETHAVRSVQLLAVQHRPGARVLRAGDEFFEATEFLAPTRCRAEEGDCATLVSAVDARERWSHASATDLADKETIELEFPARTARVGLALTGRNTLLNTFLFYQALAYLGSTASEQLAQFERLGGLGALALQRAWQRLGAISVSVKDSHGRWRDAGQVWEVGPIAMEEQMLLLPPTESAEPRHVRLELTRGYWRLDAVRLATLGEALRPVRLQPSTVSRHAARDEGARARLRDPDQYLITLPGDEYVLGYDLPEGPSELFLEARGYYYEWMRESWLKEESREHFDELIRRPEVALRRLAPEYARMESDMDAIFWSSRIARGKR